MRRNEVKIHREGSPLFRRRIILCVEKERTEAGFIRQFPRMISWSNTSWRGVKDAIFRRHPVCLRSEKKDISPMPKNRRCFYRKINEGNLLGLSFFLPLLFFFIVISWLCPWKNKKYFLIRLDVFTSPDRIVFYLMTFFIYFFIPCCRVVG